MQPKKPGMSEMEKYARTRNWANLAMAITFLVVIVLVVLWVILKAIVS